MVLAFRYLPRSSSLKPSAPSQEISAACSTTINTDAPANLNAGIGGSDPNEARAILRARIATGAQMLCSRLWRFFARLINRLSSRAPSWQYCKNDYKDDFSHKSFYRVARAIPTDNAANVCLRQRCGSECVLDAIVHMRDPKVQISDPRAVNPSIIIVLASVASPHLCDFHPLRT
jgi:hypothetical protein